MPPVDRVPSRADTAASDLSFWVLLDLEVSLDCL